MASYKDAGHVHKNESDEFDKVYEPGISAPHAGIYRCVGCGHEIGIARGHTLPSQSHPQHSAEQGKIRWKLLVYAVHKND
jgi:hypothetical protein